MSRIAARVSRSDSGALPWGSLLALAAAGFITVAWETMPAGILPVMSESLGVSESLAGQMVTVYAIGSIAGAIPIISATAGWPRRRLLTTALLGFVVTMLIVAASPWFVVTLAARFVAGIFAGVLWGILAGYASRLTPQERRGQGLTIALSGPPIALAIGTPLGAFVADMVGWRLMFVILAGCTAATLVWVFIGVPDFPGQPRGERVPVLKAARLPGVAGIIAASVFFVVGHNVLYTYAAPFLASLNMSKFIGAFLLTFGVCALIGLWVAGVVIDRHLRTVMIVSVILFASSMLVLGILSRAPALVFVSAGAWGLGFGAGGSAVPQTALANAARSAVDTAQSILVTAWNVGIATGGAIGGAVLAGIGAAALPFTTFALLVPVLVIVLVARRHSFPRRRGPGDGSKSSAHPTRVQESPRGN
ncbi:MFS transporter [Arthrobacter sp. B0490]|uniref:MFS transporter n=1 Tax=Arthrobacter sp. B0490 TaxID=2058891 RepID=UPI000CE3C610|nr:MFS transporter [Arthrobacter sp. B0490]